ncbi:MAG: 16S rRNA (cytosine(1402)-N(4))-methyltransferase RsmH [Acidimicrobiales bacterium]
MRSPSTGMVEDFFSALFCSGRLGTYPRGASLVEGLQMARNFAHDPVMVDEVVALFGPVPAGVVVDGTAGGAGHAEALLDAHAHLGVLALDRDTDAAAASVQRLARFGSRAVVRHTTFDRMEEVFDEEASRPGSWPQWAAGPAVSGVLLDLGLSSPQLDRPERGFSYRMSGPVDMRMDTTAGPSAADLVNSASEEELSTLFAANGEGRFARRIAREIARARPITTTSELAGIVAQAVPAPARRRGHPARRVFQALRIAVNDELSQLSRALPAALRMLAPTARLVVVSYHSGEDRLVKAAFAEAVTGGCTCPPRLPCVCGARPAHELVFRGARKPSAAEVTRNHRSKSARLRAIQRSPAA